VHTVKQTELTFAALLIGDSLGDPTVVAAGDVGVEAFVGRRVSANVDGDEQLIGETCDSDVGSGVADELLMFTSVDSSGLQLKGVDGLVVGLGGEE